MAMASKKKQGNNMPGAWGNTSAYGWNPVGGTSMGSSSNFGASASMGWGAPNATANTAWGAPIGGFNAGKVITVLSRGRLIACLLMGLLGVFLSLFLYKRSDFPSIMKIGLVALFSAGFPLLGAVIFTKLSKQKRQLRSGAFFVLLIALVLLFVAGSGMQFLYSLGVTEHSLDIQDYLFVIDDSGSMSSSDPQNKRIVSMRDMLENVTAEKRIGLVAFTELINFDVPLAEAQPAQIERMLNASQQMNSNGGTDIYRALDHSLRMLDDDQNRNAMIVLLTDGASQYALHTNELVKRCEDQGVVISAICMEQFDRNALSKLTGRTGGQLYSVDDPDLLQEIYRNINIVRYDRDLLGVRIGPSHGSILLGMLRVLAWLLLGAILGGALILTIESDQTPQLQLFVSMIAGLVLGILLEICNSLWLEGTIFRGVGLLLYGFVFIFVRKAMNNTTAWGQGNVGTQSSLYMGTNQELKNIATKLEYGNNELLKH